MYLWDPKQYRKLTERGRNPNHPMDCILKFAIPTKPIP